MAIAKIDVTMPACFASGGDPAGVSKYAQAKDLRLSPELAAAAPLQNQYLATRVGLSLHFQEFDWLDSSDIVSSCGDDHENN